MDFISGQLILLTNTIHKIPDQFVHKPGKRIFCERAHLKWFILIGTTPKALVFNVISSAQFQSWDFNFLFFLYDIIHLYMNMTRNNQSLETNKCQYLACLY